MDWHSEPKAELRLRTTSLFEMLDIDVLELDRSSFALECDMSE